ncbi:hypothetical protein BZ160_14290 [Pantoea vagans]|nr:hypothetical protein [Pantoea vagans]OQV40449.1 hypothetical protein BZ160_14290 [Pantoea vagans]
MKDSQEDYINDITERVFLIQRELSAGKIKVSPHLIEGIISSLNNIRLLPDGRVDPDTVDGTIRAMGSAVRHFTERLDIKKNHSIQDLQKSYFDHLFYNFGEVYEFMVNAKEEPWKVASFLSTKVDFVKSIDESFEEIYSNIQKFWEVASEIGIIHLQDGDQIKATFSGDMFPSYSQNVVSTAGLYVDTIVLPCPVLRVGRLHGAASKKEFCRLLLKHVLTCMTYREIALEEFNPAVALVLPDSRDYSQDDKEFMQNISEPMILKHAGFLYGREFSEKGEFEDFSRSLKDINAVMKALKNPQRLVFDIEWGGDAHSQLSRIMSDSDRISAKLFDNHAGMEVYFNCLGRIPQAMAAKENAQSLGSTPLINAETSWLYYTWLLEYNTYDGYVDSAEIKNLHMVHAISSGMDDGFAWLGKIPLENIIELRRKNLLSEVRETLSSGVEELIFSNKEDYLKTSQRVVDNVDSAFIRHQRFLKKAREEKLKIYGLDIGPCILNGAIAITAAYTGSVALGTISAGLGMLGLPSLKDIKSKIKDSDERLNTYKNTATGMLFKSIK